LERGRRIDVHGLLAVIHADGWLATPPGKPQRLRRIRRAAAFEDRQGPSIDQFASSTTRHAHQIDRFLGVNGWMRNPVAVGRS
jgi:hypothetical protein